MSTPRTYLIYLKARTSSHHMIPEDWQNKVRGVRGVQVVGTSPRQLQIEADDAAIAEVRQRVQAHCEVVEA